MITGVYIGAWKVDLFEDDTIEVIDSVVDISDITKNTTSFSKTFTVPPSKRNNILFKHWYNANIDNTFDARIKVAGRITLDGMTFKNGKFTLEKVSVKKDVPSAYTIRFTGNMVDIKTKVKKDELSLLDLTAFDHDYDSATVKTGLTSSLFSGDVVYPLLAKKQYYYNGVFSDNTQTESLSNIASTGGLDTGIVWSDLRPAIREIKIIEAIEAKYSLTFSRDFFGTSEFTDRFLWLNNSAERNLVGNSQRVDFVTNGVDTWMNIATDVGTYPLTTTSSSFIYFKLELRVTPTTASLGIPYSIIMYRDGEVIRETNHEGSILFPGDTQSTNIAAPTGTTENAQIYYEVKANQEFVYDARLRQIQKNQIPFGSDVTEDNDNVQQTVTSDFVVADNMPKIKIIDYLKGVFNEFKLVVIPEDDGSMYVNTLNAYYADGALHDITEYVDFSSYDAERGEILNEISLKFQEPTTILNQQFKENTGLAYGDEEVILEDENGELLDGDDFSFELPFEQIVYERLRNLDNNIYTNVQYGAIIDQDLNPVNPKPHFFYNINNPLGSPTVAFIDDAGVKSTIQTINTPSHTNVFVDPVYSTIFGSEINEYSGDTITETLYKRHFENFITSVFDIKKRTFIYEATLPLGLMLNLKLNDVVKIKENYYRPNKNKHNIIDGKSTLELINTFDNRLNQFLADTGTITTDFTVKTESVTITNSLGATSLKVDVGDGTGWVTVTTISATANTFYLTFTENTTADDRIMFITFTQAVTGVTTDILITQQTELYVPSYRFYDSRNSQYLTLI